MSEQSRRLVNVNGVRLHVVEQGEGPLVVLVHGFPELWYSWRFQLPAVASAGFRAVAFDQRGYGRSSKFWNTHAYTIHRLVDDVVGLVQALGERRAILIGHEWGAPVVWTAAWLHPEMFRGVLGMCVPFSGRGVIALPGNPFGERPPHEMHRIMSGPDQDFYPRIKCNEPGIQGQSDTDYPATLYCCDYVPPGVGSGAGTDPND